MPANPKKYSEYIKDQIKTSNKGCTMFTDTRCHFRLDEKGPDLLQTVEEEFVVVTHKNVTRSFSLALFSLVVDRKFEP
jgi:hypothetical protein